jgi:Fe2+ transport system protein FeoA
MPMSNVVMTPRHSTQLLPAKPATRRLVKLSDLDVGATARVVHVGLLDQGCRRRFAEIGIHEGAKISIAAGGAGADTLILAIGGSRMGVSAHCAGQVMVLRT